MNVLAVRHDNNGDVLLTGPAVRALATGASQLTFACGPSGRAAAEALPGVERVLCFEAGWIEAFPSPVTRETIERNVAAVAECRIDRAVIFTSFHQSPLPAALVLRMAGVPWIAAISEDYAGSLLDARHRDVPDDIHEVERALSLARFAGYDLPPGDAGRLAMIASAENPVPGGPGYVVVHPGATVPARAWSPAANRALVEALASAGTRVVVTGGASERELCGFVAADRALDTSGTTDFRTLGRVIADAGAIVVGNTGTAHVAAAFGTPVVSIFAPTIPAARFHPWMTDHVVLGDQAIACRGCRARVCPRGDHACVSGIAVDDVLTALRGLLRSGARA